MPRSLLLLAALAFSTAAPLRAQSESLRASARLVAPVRTTATAPRISVDARKGGYTEISAETPTAARGEVVVSVALSATASENRGSGPTLVRDPEGKYRMARGGAARGSAGEPTSVGADRKASYRVEISKGEEAIGDGVTVTYLVAVNG